MKVGDLVRISGTDREGIVTNIHEKKPASSGLRGADGECEYNPQIDMPGWVEIDGFIQVHPSRVEVIEEM